MTWVEFRTQFDAKLVWVGLHCRKCGGVLRRVHRSIPERFRYYGIFECRTCQERFGRSRRLFFYFGPACRCPNCGTFKVSKLGRPDRIDPMYRHPFNVLQRLFDSSRLFHCRFCRIQFYDRRPAMPGAVSDPAAAMRIETGRVPSQE